MRVFRLDQVVKIVPLRVVVMYNLRNLVSRLLLLLGGLLREVIFFFSLLILAIKEALRISYSGSVLNLQGQLGVYLQVVRVLIALLG